MPVLRKSAFSLKSAIRRHIHICHRHLSDRQYIKITLRSTQIVVFVLSLEFEHLLSYI